MGTRLAGKVALVTGSTAGIGRASAELFAEEGAKVVINDHGLVPHLGQETVDGIRARGGTASYFCANVTRSDDIKSLVDFGIETYGRLDILMSNAYSGHTASVLETEEADWDQAFAVSVKAAFLASKHAIPHMIQNGGGAIVLVSSVHGVLAARGNASYNTMKAALINLTRQMAIEYGQYGIRVNAMCPGRILTEAKLVMLSQHPEEVRRQKLIYPLGRPGTMREAANVALFLASDDASFVTGHALVVDGGLTAQLPDSAAAWVEQGLGL
jgi:NAD(P)-dependent dehydrogenase (short-subunit alcohol dehydrogenase family)